MKFLVDMPLSPSVAEWLNARGHKAIHAFHAGLSKATDAEIIRHALKQEQAIITCDLDFPQLLASAADKGPSIILIRGGNYGQQDVLDLLDRVLRAIPEQNLMQSIVVADKKNIRKTKLPLKPAQ